MIVSYHSKDIKSLKEVVKFKIIQAESPLTFERLNIGIMIEKQDAPPRIEFVENIEVYSSIFPMVSLKDIEISLKYINLKSKRGKINSQAKKITSFISISETKLIYSDENEIEIIDGLLEQYITLRKTNRYIKNFFQFANYVEDRIKTFQKPIQKVEVISFNHNKKEAQLSDMFESIKQLRSCR